ncbi:oligosaccharide repeat unit polymerase [Aeromonas sp. FDAARGOS 1416]|uniref:oligosaccharide repeat unit polymerase n=1 Tax=Aeromonas TaxID=642 RepID=UPI001C23E1C4|nr:oligosaccharide repeat unit polymerase [Aeromonas sp. FDAARGOS 1416]QXB02310.1 oligosaccharide repeat unit polymerase [Aeromonas sp. FDAARGOS 1416]
MATRSKKSDFFSSTSRARILFLVLYVVANIYAYLTMVDIERYVGDYSFSLNTKMPLLLILLMVLFSYYVVCGPIYNFGIKIKASFPKMCSVNRLLYFGWSVLFLQILYFIYNFTTGSNYAGASNPEGVVRFLWLILPVDYIFYIYYVFARTSKSKLVKFNLFIFALSQLSRGWLGWLLVFIYVELCFWLKRNDGNIRLKLKRFYIYILFIPVLGLFPLLVYLKVAMRDALSLQDLSVLYGIINELDFNFVFLSFFDALFFRLQHFSNVVFVYDNLNIIRDFLQSDRVAMFYFEGLFPQLISKLINITPGEDIHLFLYSYFVNDKYFTETTLQTGFVSWLFFDIGTSIIYLSYILLLIFSSIYLSKKTGSHEVQSLTWFFVFLYLMNGWFNAYLLYMQALIIVCFFLRVRSGISFNKAICEYRNENNETNRS